MARAAEDVRLTAHRHRWPARRSTCRRNRPAATELDARSDLFSLGVVLYELAAGEPPFSGKTPLAVLKSLTEDKPVPLRERNPDLPEWFVHIVDRLLAKDPKDRFQSAREVAGTLEHFWALLKSSEVVICPKKKAANFWKAVGLGTAAGLATLMLGTLAAFFLLPLGNRPEEKIPEPVHVFKGTSGLWSMAVSKDGKNLAVGADNGSVKYWDIAAEKVLSEWPAHKGPSGLWHSPPTAII